MYDAPRDFTADRFTPTQWQSTETKVRFARQIIQAGFSGSFFTSTEGKVLFLRKSLQHPCWGSPDFTFADVEKAIQTWLVDNGEFANYERRLRDEQEEAERVELERHQRKHGGSRE